MNFAVSDIFRRSFFSDNFASDILTVSWEYVAFQYVPILTLCRLLLEGRCAAFGVFGVELGGGGDDSSIAPPHGDFISTFVINEGVVINMQILSVAACAEVAHNMHELRFPFECIHSKTSHSKIVIL